MMVVFQSVRLLINQPTSLPLHSVYALTLRDTMRSLDICKEVAMNRPIKRDVCICASILKLTYSNVVDLKVKKGICAPNS